MCVLVQLQKNKKAIYINYRDSQRERRSFTPVKFTPEIMKRTEWGRQKRGRDSGMVWVYRGFLLYKGKAKTLGLGG